MHCLPQYWRDLFGRNGSGSFCFQPLHFPSLSPVPAYYVVEGPARSDRGTSYFHLRTPDHQRPPAPSRPNQDNSLHSPAWIGRRSRSYGKSFAGRVFLQEPNLLLCRIDCPCRGPLFARLREYFCSSANHSRSTHSFRRRQPSRPRPHPGCLNLSTPAILSAPRSLNTGNRLQRVRSNEPPRRRPRVWKEQHQFEVLQKPQGILAPACPAREHAGASDPLLSGTLRPAPPARAPDVFLPWAGCDTLCGPYATRIPDRVIVGFWCAASPLYPEFLRCPRPPLLPNHIPQSSFGPACLSRRIAALSPGQRMQSTGLRRITLVSSRPSLVIIPRSFEAR